MNHSHHPNVKKRLRNHWSKAQSKRKQRKYLRILSGRLNGQKSITLFPTLNLSLSKSGLKQKQVNKSVVSPKKNQQVNLKKMMMMIYSKEMLKISQKKISKDEDVVSVKAILLIERVAIFKGFFLRCFAIKFRLNKFRQSYCFQLFSRIKYALFKYQSLGKMIYLIHLACKALVEDCVVKDAADPFFFTLFCYSFSFFITFLYIPIILRVPFLFQTKSQIYSPKLESSTIIGYCLTLRVNSFIDFRSNQEQLRDFSILILVAREEYAVQVGKAKSSACKMASYNSIIFCLESLYSEKNFRMLSIFIALTSLYFEANKIKQAAISYISLWLYCLHLQQKKLT